MSQSLSRPARSVTAINMAARELSKPEVRLIGLFAGLEVVNACTSTRSARRPSIVIVIQVPGTA